MQSRPGAVSGLFAGRYVIERVIGQGATAFVHLARDTQTGISVALKVLRPELAESTATARFLKEIRRTSELQHPHILPVLDSGEHDGALYFALPYMEGGTLRQLLNQEKNLPLERVVEIARPIASALDYAHGKGLVHRDVKPENILFTAGKAVLSDFGIARAIDLSGSTDATTSKHSVRGTAAYMSPEQAAGSTDLDGRSDVYSLACVIYEMITGMQAFIGPTPESVISQRFLFRPREIRVYRPTVPAALDGALAKAFVSQPVDRYRTAGQLVDAVEATLTQPSETRDVGYADLEKKAVRQANGGTPSSRTARVFVAIGVSAVALAAFVIWRGLESTPPDPRLIAVLPFDVAPAELRPMSRSVMEQLARNLDGVAPLRTVPPSDVIRDWSGEADLASARRVGRRTGAGLSVVGSIQRLGSDSVRLTGAVYDLGSGAVLGEGSVGGHEARLAQATDSLYVEILRILSRARHVGSFRTPLGTKSLSAFKAFLSGEHYFRRTVWDSAQAFFDQAVELDSTFAMAHHRLFIVHTMKGSGIDTLVSFHAKRAGRLNRGLSPRDSILIAADSVKAVLEETLVGDWTIATERTQRFFSTLEVATRRFPEDAEMWYQLATAKIEYSLDRIESTIFALDALDRAIAVDSGFGPAYEFAILLSTETRGAADAARYIKAYLALNPTGPSARAAHIVAALSSPTLDAADIDPMLKSASALELFKVYLSVNWWPDTTQLSIRIAEELRRRGPEVAMLSQSPTFTLNLHALALAYHGRVREAYDAVRRWRPAHQPAMLTELAFLGAIPRDSASGDIAAIVRGDGWTPRTVMPALAWWYHTGDTSSLGEALRRNAGSRRDRGPDAQLTSAFVDQSARGMLALLRGDSARALGLMRAVGDSVCYRCTLQQLIAERVATGLRRDDEAARIIDRMIVSNEYPLATLLRLDRARIAERLGDRARAGHEYSMVAGLWSKADSSLQSFVREARAGALRTKTR